MHYLYSTLVDIKIKWILNFPTPLFQHNNISHSINFWQHRYILKKRLLVLSQNKNEQKKYKIFTKKAWWKIQNYISIVNTFSSSKIFFYEIFIFMFSFYMNFFFVFCFNKMSKFLFCLQNRKNGWVNKVLMERKIVFVWFHSPSYLPIYFFYTFKDYLDFFFHFQIILF